MVLCVISSFSYTLWNMGDLERVSGDPDPSPPTPGKLPGQKIGSLRISDTDRPPEAIGPKALEKQLDPLKKVRKAPCEKR